MYIYIYIYIYHILCLITNYLNIKSYINIVINKPNSAKINIDIYLYIILHVAYQPTDIN